MSRIISIDGEDKYLFIHIAKTGGTFFKEALNYIGISNRETGLLEEDDHLSYKQCILKYPELEKLDAITLIRKPSDWIVSRWKWAIYTHFIDKCNYNIEAKNHWMNGVWDNKLSKFLENIIDLNPHVCSEYFSSMVEGANYITIFKSPVIGIKYIDKRNHNLLMIKNNKRINYEVNNEEKKLLQFIDIMENDFIEQYNL